MDGTNGAFRVRRDRPARHAATGCLMVADSRRLGCRGASRHRRPAGDLPPPPEICNRFTRSGHRSAALVAAAAGPRRTREALVAILAEQRHLVALALDRERRPSSDRPWPRSIARLRRRHRQRRARARARRASRRPRPRSWSRGDDLVDEPDLERARRAESAARAGSAPSRAPRRSSRGRRCVPPAPGMMPSRTSVSPTSAPSTSIAEVARHRELEPAAVRRAVHRADRRLADRAASRRSRPRSR